MLGLEILEGDERASSGVGITHLPGRPTEIPTLPQAADRQLGHPRSGLPAAIDAALAPCPSLPGHPFLSRSGIASAVRASWLALRPGQRPDATSRCGCPVPAPSLPADRRAAPSSPRVDELARVDRCGWGWTWALTARSRGTLRPPKSQSRSIQGPASDEPATQFADVGHSAQLFVLSSDASSSLGLFEALASGSLFGLRRRVNVWCAPKRFPLVGSHHKGGSDSGQFAI